MMHVFTSITANYIPKARVLMRSIKRHEPDVVTHLLLLDDAPHGFPSHDEPFDHVLSFDDLPIDDAKAWLFKHRIVEACTAVKPFALLYLLNKGADQVCYFDPDIAIFDNLNTLRDAFQTSSVLLTPHVCEPEATVEAIRDNEINALKHGVYNLGFVGVKNDDTGRAYAEWWAERCYHFCLDDIPSGLFTDQRWNDLVPVFFDHVGVLKHPGLNVATWNYAQRRLEGDTPESVRVNGAPLIFHHFSGYDSGAHHVMRDKYGKTMPAALMLSRWYEAECQKEGQKFFEKISWVYGYYDNRTQIQDAHRRLYRHRQDLQTAFPNPYHLAPTGVHESSYFTWLKSERLFDADTVIGLTPPKSFKAFLRDTRAHTLNYISGTSRLLSWQKRLFSYILRGFFKILESVFTLITPRARR